MKRLIIASAITMMAVSGAFCAEKSFVTLPLAKGANTVFMDDEPKDRKGGWIDEGANNLKILTPGVLEASGVRFNILSDATSQGKSCIVLGGPKRDYLPKVANIPLDGEQGKVLYLLHGSAHCPSVRERPMAGVLEVHYADGKTYKKHVRYGRDVGEWTSPKAYANAFRVWTEYNGSTQVSLFASKFPLEAKPIKSINFEARDCTWMVVAATLGDDVKLKNIKHDLTLDKKYIAPPTDRPLPNYNAGATPKNIILLIGDGMGPGAIQLTSLYQHGAENKLLMEQLPVNTRCVTLSHGEKVTDSAASATAIATGHKTINGRLGIDVEKRRIHTVAEIARQQQGRGVAIMTSDSLTGATPAGFFAHVSSRGKIFEVAQDAAASGFDILIGNNNTRNGFFEKADGGQREDGRNIAREMEKNGYVLIKNQAEFDKVPLDKRVLGIMDKGTLDDEQCLAKLAETAFTRLTRSDKGFFMMLECTITDGGGHGNNPELSVRGTLQVDWAAKAALDFAAKNPDTLIMITADHETGGLSSTISGGKIKIAYDTTSHTDIPVRFLAFGPGSHLFNKPLIDNTDIANNIAKLWQLRMPPPEATQESAAK